MVFLSTRVPSPFQLQHKRKYDLFAHVNFISNTPHKFHSQLRALHLLLSHLHNLSFAFTLSSLSSSTETPLLISSACVQSTNSPRTSSEQFIFQARQLDPSSLWLLVSWTHCSVSVPVRLPLSVSSECEH